MYKPNLSPKIVDIRLHNFSYIIINKLCRKYGIKNTVQLKIWNIVCRLLNMPKKFDVTNAAIKYKTNRQYIYRWKRRYDSSMEPLRLKITQTSLPSVSQKLDLKSNDLGLVRWIRDFFILTKL